MFAARPYVRPHGRPRMPASYGFNVSQARALFYDALRLSWPFVLSALIACLMLVCAIVIAALEIASLATSTDSFLYGGTASIGAGIWCQFAIVIAALLILSINCFHKTFLWATAALIATIIAAAFAIILIGLDAQSVKYSSSSTATLPLKVQYLAAQLSLAVFEVVLCIAFILIYVFVFIISIGRTHRRQYRSGW